MELQGGDTVPPVSLSWDLWSQDLQAVPGRKACEKKFSKIVMVHFITTSADNCYPGLQCSSLTFSMRVDLAGVTPLANSPSWCASIYRIKTGSKTDKSHKNLQIKKTVLVFLQYAVKVISHFTWAEGCPSRSKHTIAAHLEGLGEVQIVENEQVPWGSGDEHLGTVGRQTHPH